MRNSGRILWILILVMYVLYAGVFIYRTSFVVEGKRYFSLFDDAMISMRYAKNLAQGHGLVWNPGGEKVEGFSDPLWVFFMAIFHLFPISPAKICLFIQISGAIFLIVNFYLVKRIADFISGGSILVSLGAVALTAFYLPLNNWALQGMEVGVLTLLLGLAVWKTLKLLAADDFSPIWVGGDAWDWWGGSNRYFSIVMPVFFILFIYSLQKFKDLLQRLNLDKIPRMEKLISWGLAAFLIFSLINFNIINESGFLRNWLLLDAPLFVDLNKIRVEEALLLTRITDNQASIAVTWGGIIPYFADRKAVDILGKNDRTIAREKMRTLPGWRKLIYFIPGHLKWNYKHSFGELKPDVIVQMWWNRDEAAPFLKTDYMKEKVGKSHFYFRKGSSHVLWDMVKKATADSPAY